MKNKSRRLTKFIRRMNRGIALGVVVVLIMAVWISVSTCRVRQAEGELEEITQSFIIDLFEISSLMNDDELGGALSDETALQMQNELQNLVDEYYTSSGDAKLALDASNYRRGGQKLIDGFFEWQKKASVFHIEDVKINIADDLSPNNMSYRNYTFYATQKASKFVEVYFYCEVEATVRSHSPYMHNLSVYPFCENDGAVPYYEGAPSISDGKYEMGPFENKVKFNVSGRIIFVRDNGEWRIACTENLYGYLSSNTATPIIPKEVQ